MMDVLGYAVPETEGCGVRTFVTVAALSFLVSRCLGQTSSDVSCQSHKCYNGGTCQEHNWECSCRPSYFGILCQTDVVYACDPNPCKNGAECKVDGNSRQCYCASKYHGDLCQLMLPSTGPCSSLPCDNGGTCTEGTDTFGSEIFICKCKTGFTGRKCNQVNEHIVDFLAWSRNSEGKAVKYIDEDNEAIMDCIFSTIIPDDLTMLVFNGSKTFPCKIVKEQPEICRALLKVNRIDHESHKWWCEGEDGRQIYISPTTLLNVHYDPASDPALDDSVGNADKDTGGVDVGTVIGISIGIILLTVMLVCTIYLVHRRKKMREQEEEKEVLTKNQPAAAATSMNK